MPICDASTSSSNCQLGSGLTRTGALVISVISFSCAARCLGPHSKGTPLPVRHVIGAAIVEKLGTNILWYPQTPRRPLASLRVLMLRGYSVRPATLAGSIVAPCFEMRTPKKSIWGCIKIDFESFR